MFLSKCRSFKELTPTLLIYLPLVQEAERRMDQFLLGTDAREVMGVRRSYVRW